MKFDLKNFEEITATFDQVYTTSSENYAFEAVGKTTLPLQIEDQVDFDFLIASLPKGIINEKTFSKKRLYLYCHYNYCIFDSIFY